MTPEEAMKGPFAAAMSEDDRSTLKLMLDWIKDSATRRCADLVDALFKRARAENDASGAAWLQECRDDILRAGGLEVEP